MSVRRSAIPDGSLIARYKGQGNHVDAYVASTARYVDLPTYIAAFFSTSVFRAERLLLSISGKQSSDDQVADLAAGRGEHIAAWKVEERSANELLLEATGTPIRTWLAVEPDGTALWFGSVVLAKKGRIPLLARVMMPGHALYSRILLSAALRQVS
ncbi:MAG: hypothetical protein AAFY97_06945 [Pseudomonadota bacterium]